MSLKRKHLDSDLEDRQEMAGSSTWIGRKRPLSDSSLDQEGNGEEKEMEVDLVSSDDEEEQESSFEERAALPVKEWFDEDTDSDDEVPMMTECPLEEGEQATDAVIHFRDYRKLLKKAFKDTFDMYKNLKKERKPLPSGLMSDPRRHMKCMLKTLCVESSAPFLHTKMQYFFDSECHTSPFIGLRLNRCAENGELLMPCVWTEWEERNFHLQFSLEKSLQYMLLLKEMQDHFADPMWNGEGPVILTHYLDRAKEMKPRYLLEFDVHVCVDEAWRSRCVAVLEQEWKFYRLLSQIEMFEMITPQKVLANHKFWDQVQNDLPLIDRDTFKHKIESLGSSDDESLSQRLKMARDEAGEQYERAREKWNTAMPPGRYYELKYKKALELGIIKHNKEGRLVENLDVSTWKIS